MEKTEPSSVHTLEFASNICIPLLHIEKSNSIVHSTLGAGIVCRNVQMDNTTHCCCHCPSSLWVAFKSTATSLRTKVNTADLFFFALPRRRLSPTLTWYLFNNRLIKIMRSAIDENNDDGLFMCVGVCLSGK